MKQLLNIGVISQAAGSGRSYDGRGVKRNVQAADDRQSRNELRILQQEKIKLGKQITCKVPH